MEMKGLLYLVVALCLFESANTVQISVKNLLELQRNTRIKEHFDIWNRLDTRATTEEFKCDVNVFKNVSSGRTVHELTPADIGAVAALGDSLTAGFGVDAANLLEMFTEWRGESWSIGGDKSLEEGVVTLPNVLKKYNPKLKGYALGTNFVLNRKEEVSHLDVAISAAVAKGMLAQAKTLVQRVKSEGLTNEWKIVTFFIGGNDHCQWCRFKDALSPENYGMHIKAALDYLHQNLDKALVNLILPIDTTMITHLNETAFCNVLHRVIECPCPLAAKSYAAMDEVKEIVVQFRTQLLDLVATGRYDTTDDFTVVIQPFYANQRIPIVDGHADFSYFAPDCFHFSRKGQGDAAQALWNNMLEPAGRKRFSWQVKDTWQCPTAKNPYLYTYRNDVNS